MKRRRLTRSQIVRAAIVAVLLVLLIVLLTRDESDGGSAAGEPRIVSAAELSELTAELDHPVYWLGRRSGSEYEFEEASTGKVQIRYLEPGSKAGEVSSGEALTVVTYPAKDGAAEVERAAEERDGAELGRTKDDAVLLVDPGSANNAHLAYPGDAVHVEIFSPTPGEALRLAVDGAVEPVS